MTKTAHTLGEGHCRYQSHLIISTRNMRLFTPTNGKYKPRPRFRIKYAILEINAAN